MNFQDRLLKHIKRWNELVGNIDHPNLFKETNMNHFVGWKIGIPVKVTAKYQGNQDASGCVESVIMIYIERD